ncbi:MAG: TlpA family protein disulfide reductase, partial [Muribaculaceae bacterium]
MRKFLLFVSMGLCAACSWAGVKVELKGFDNDSVQVRWYNPVSRARIAQDSMVVANNGKFALADMKEPALILLLPRQYAGRDAAQLYVAPGEKFEVKLTKGADGMDVVTKGSKLQAMIDEVSAQRDALAKQINGEKDEAKRDSLISLYYKVTTDYVEQNLDTPITLWALSMTNVEFCEKMLPKVGANAKTGMFAGLDQKLAERIKREKEVHAAKKLTAEGEMAPDFELPTPDGSTLKMSSLRGKWVIVDFWGSWCIWCIRGIP